MNKGNKYVIGYKPTGVVHSITNMSSGEVNVKQQSH